VNDVFKEKMQSALVWVLLFTGFILGYVTRLVTPEINVLIHYWNAP
jgi:hypothetical protein